MKYFKIVSMLAFLSLFAMAQAQAAGKGNGNGNGNGSGSGNGHGSKDNIETILGSVPAAELPGKAADLVMDAKPKDRESLALAAVRFTANEQPMVISALVSSVTRALPESAAAIALTAAKLAPTQVSEIKEAALQSAPGYSTQITRALETLNPGSVDDVAPPKPGKDNGNRPTIPPGQEGKTIRGNRPATPPGHVVDAKPGRDPQRRHYGRP